MIIRINENIEAYKETIAMGMTGRQTIFSGAALLVGAGVILGLFQKIGIMASCYVATPVIIPIALMGFYEMNGMNFFQFFSRFIHSFKMKPLLYYSTESIKAYQKMVEVPKKEASRREKQAKRDRKRKRRERRKIRKDRVDELKKSKKRKSNRQKSR